MRNLSLTDRLSAALDRARSQASATAHDDLEDLIVEVAMLELGADNAAAWAARRRGDDQGQGALPLAADASIADAIGRLRQEMLKVYATNPPIHAILAHMLGINVTVRGSTREMDAKQEIAGVKIVTDHSVPDHLFVVRSRKKD